MTSLPVQQRDGSNIELESAPNLWGNYKTMFPMKIIYFEQLMRAIASWTIYILDSSWDFLPGGLWK